MQVLVLIPARMASSRLPSKPLADIGGKPMVVRVLEQALKAGVGEVYVAAGDPEIVAAVTAHGGRAVLTDAVLPSGSDRIWQATQRLVAQGMAQPDIVINAQGDEPLLPPELVVQAVEILQRRPEVDVVTYAHVLGHPLTTAAEMADPAVVKVVVTAEGRALYFSRAGIPYGAAQMLRHVGFYGYRTAALQRFVQAPPAALELQERLEQLRGLALGLHYHVALTDHEPIGVDTPADLAKVRELFAKGQV